MATAGSAPSTIGAASSIGRILLAFLLSAATLGGSLYFSWGMQLKACPLCFYQRTFAMSLVAVLFMGLLSGMARSARIGLLALPLAAGGLGVALNHVWLEVGANWQCPPGIFGWETAPKDSLAMFAVLFLLLLWDGWKTHKKATVIIAVILGGMLAAAACTSNPPPKPTDDPSICHPPVETK